MKRIFILVVGIFILTACNSGEEVTCNIDGKEAIFTLKNGIITSYTLGNEKISRSTIDEINGTYFTSATNNEEWRTALTNYVDILGGSCN